MQARSCHRWWTLLSHSIMCTSLCLIVLPTHTQEEEKNTAVFWTWTRSTKCVTQPHLSLFLSVLAGLYFAWLKEREVCRETSYCYLSFSLTLSHKNVMWQQVPKLRYSHCSHFVMSWFSGRNQNKTMLKLHKCTFTQNNRNGEWKDGTSVRKRGKDAYLVCYTGPAATKNKHQDQKFSLSDVNRED